MTFLSRFSIAVSELIPYVKTAQFPTKLASLFKELVPIDNVMIISYPRKRLPIIEYNDLPPDSATSTAKQFIKGAFLLDPYYLAVKKQKKNGFFHLNEISPACFKETEYYRIYYQLSGLKDECGYLINLEEQGRKFINISLGQIKIGENFTEEQLQNLADIYPLIQTLVRTHWLSTDVEPDIQLDLREQLEMALQHFGTSILTERENQMVQMILHGYSSKAIAERFNISVETVKLHRKNAYAKLDLGTQGELFNLFINSLINIEDYKGGDPLVLYHSANQNHSANQSD